MSTSSRPEPNHKQAGMGQCELAVCRLHPGPAPGTRTPNRTPKAKYIDYDPGPRLDLAANVASYLLLKLTSVTWGGYGASYLLLKLTLTNPRIFHL